MGRFIIRGGRALRGDVRVSGSKNAALPIIFASLITRGVTEIQNLPDITDVHTALEIIAELGAEVSRINNTVYIDTTELSYRIPSDDKVAKLRASTYLIGAGLPRFGRARLQSFGGCNFSKRPIDMHIYTAVKFGAREEGDELVLEKLHAADICFGKKSVGATVNALIMASAGEGVSRISGYAEEPHVSVLIEYLRSAGAEIRVENGILHVHGGNLHGGRITIPGDMIEAGTYLAASLVTNGSLNVGGFDTSELDSFISHLRCAGAKVIVDRNAISLSGAPETKMDILTSAYPGFPTDLQPIFAVIMARFHGGRITEGVWQGRFGYLSELAKLGVSYVIDDNGAKIYPSLLTCGIMRSTDLRGGAAGIIAALVAKGESTVLSGESVLRGYERLDEKLRKVGADIIYVEG